MAKKRKTRLTPEFWRRDAELRREMAERIAYHELQGEGEPSWKDRLDPETRRRVEERADEILGAAGRQD
jgi:hypothetical protein